MSDRGQLSLIKIIVLLTFYCSLGVHPAFAANTFINMARFDDGSRYYVMFVAKGSDHAYVIYCVEDLKSSSSTCSGYGLYPQSNAFAAAPKVAIGFGIFPGDVKNEALYAVGHPYGPWGGITETVTVMVDAFDWDAVANHLDNMYKHPPQYQAADILADNCVGFVKQSADILGLPGPLSVGHFPDGYVRALGDALKQDRVITLPSGDNYVGTVVRNLPNGRGVLTYANGTRYDGAFVQGVRDGQGDWYFKDGDHFKGSFLGNDSINGELTFAKGGRYVGDLSIVRGGADGEGRLYDKQNNLLYAGQFHANLISGPGTLYYCPDGSLQCTLTGQFANGLPNGQGMLESPSGTLVVNFVNGFPDGPAKFTTKAGKVYSGTMKNGAWVTGSIPWAIGSSPMVTIPVFQSPYTVTTTIMAQ